jgi:hypothetical protein
VPTPAPSPPFKQPLNSEPVLVLHVCARPSISLDCQTPLVPLLILGAPCCSQELHEFASELFDVRWANLGVLHKSGFDFC